MPDPRETPAMQQYYRFKKRHPECVLLFRIGDFYEMFDEDAVRVSKALGLTLTQRTEGIPMAGVPFHQLERYLRRMIDRGFRVAVCDQVQDAKEAKGIVDRAVTRVVTPGTLVDDALLRDEDVRTLGAVCFLDSGDAGSAPVAAAVAELSTGRFLVMQCTAETLPDELMRCGVTELLYADTANGAPPPRVARVMQVLGIAGTPQAAWHFRPDEAREALLQQYGVATLVGFGLSDDDPVVQPAGAVVRYLRLTQMAAEDGPASPGADQSGRPAATLAHLAPPRRVETAGHCHIDATSLRALEILRTIRTEETEGSLLGIFTGGGSAKGGPGGGCSTAMGKRFLREWLCRPIAELQRIEGRHRAVATLVEDRRAAESLASALREVQDVSRMAARIALRRAWPRDLVGLGKSLAAVRSVATAIQNAPALSGYAETLAAVTHAIGPLAERIGATCVDTPPGHIRDGGLIRDGVDAELDEARLLQRDAATWLAEYQKKLLERHRLPGLKVGYNQVFGYYIELTTAQARSAPAEFTRKQTLRNAERYITPELKEFEEKVTTAEARALEREKLIFQQLCDEAAAPERLAAIARYSDTVAELDVLTCFADKAVRRRWVQPRMTAEPTLRIEQGRHPVLDELLESNFVPNDLDLGPAPEEDKPVDAGAPGARSPSLALITGPNMAGKSTYIRQTALIVLLAHAGSFVPADRAVIGLTDRIFTRIGADDALHAGQSTFMVEMTETARILHHATARSLVILDEIGRGTSTLDGLSLAWAIAETLATPAVAAGGAEGGPRTLFATHYHELTDLEERLPGRVRNLHVAVREWGDQIVFLHRILPGRTDQSYGIHVAKLAGIPDRAIRRAREILDGLAVHHVDEHGGKPTGARKDGKPPARPRDGQLHLFTEYVPHPAMSALRELKIETLTPMQAFDELRRLKEQVQKT
jgi:DNA mismatch repair protein MutS